MSKKIQMSKKRDYVIMKFDTWRKFYEPFKCFCCGKIISKKQFCFSTLCGYCDVGKCMIKLSTTNYGEKYEKGNGQRENYKKGKIVTKLAILENLK
ncbi:hypothetical protein LCGC14_2851330 [marine sediment metagenome]|uniref:Uncharacterized protein n=1 Tax=marine sediment metagenome TaxID=412755 RepID=A0A0F8Y8A8_9ZZZZ